MHVGTARPGTSASVATGNVNPKSLHGRSSEKGHKGPAVRSSEIMRAGEDEANPARRPYNAVFQKGGVAAGTDRKVD